MARLVTRRDKAYSLVTNIFKAENEIRLAVIEAKTAERKDFCGGGGQPYKADPTAGKTVRHLTAASLIRLDTWLIHRPEDWLKVIALTYKNIGDRERVIMRKYFDGASIKEIYEQGCGYEEPTLYAMLKNFKQLAVEIACQFGLIRVVDV